MSVSHPEPEPGGPFHDPIAHLDFPTPKIAAERRAYRAMYKVGHALGTFLKQLAILALVFSVLGVCIWAFVSALAWFLQWLG